MRVTQSMMTRNYLNSLNSSLSRLSSTHEKISSGRRFTRLSEDISSGVKAMRVRRQLRDNERVQSTLKDAAGRLDAAEGCIQAISDVVQTAMPKILKSMTDTSATQREDIAKEIDNLRGEIIQFANSAFAEIYHFSGTNNVDPPFSEGADGKMLYNGVPVDNISYINGKYVYNGQPNSDDYAAAADYGSAMGDQAYTTPKGTVLMPGDPIPMDREVYVDVDLGMIINDGSVIPQTAYKISFSGLDLLGFGMGTLKGADGKNVEDSYGQDKLTSNNIVNLLADVSAALRQEPYDEKADALRGSLHTKLQDQFGTLQEEWSSVGTRTQFLETMAEKAESDEGTLLEMRNKLEGINDAEEATNYKMYEYCWLATLKMGSKVIPQSLMDFIN